MTVMPVMGHIGGARVKLSLIRGEEHAPRHGLGSCTNQRGKRVRSLATYQKSLFSERHNLMPLVPWQVLLDILKFD